ncbi:hypothetical protein ACFSJY_05325 [Thalassotalea euphylliae]|uniref:hypothetical protein n=1 Tax=Thalassotalea euphylliae TaxID=1655234 RepID=UPI00362E406B
MLFVAIFAAIFVVVSIYFYFRSERLQYELVKLKRDTAQTRKENKQLSEAIAFVAAKQEEFFKFRLNQLKEQAEELAPQVASDMTLISPLISNYANIFNACMVGKEKLQPVCQKSIEGVAAGSYQRFLKFISGQEKHVKRHWSSNNVNGLMSLIEALLANFQKEIDATTGQNKQQKTGSW